MYYNLLQIDDDPDDCELFSDALKQVSEINYTCMHNPVEAVKQLVEQKITPDIIILDMNMPVMNGMLVLQKIKNKKKLASIPVIIFSTSELAPYKENAMQLGALAYFAKPTCFSALVALLKTILNKNNC